MSGEAVGWAFRKVQMDDATAKFVLVAICNYANEEDRAWPSHAAIARLTGLSKRTIQNSIQKLEDWGIIRRDRRDRENGSETSAMVSIDLDTSWIVKGGIATAATGVTQQVPGGVAGDSTLETTVKPKGKNPKANEAYSEDFEALWKQYPRTRNTSKKDAWNFYRMMTEEKQEIVRRAVPAFAAAMRAEGRTEDKIMHMIRFLRGGVYETVVLPAAVPVPGGGPVKPFWETATRQDWINALLQWSRNWTWNRAWGPEPENPLRPVPGALKHHVPQDILDRFDLKYRGHLYSPEQKAEIQARVDAASKHAVDRDHAA